jgi:hypothetical protein
MSIVAIGLLQGEVSRNTALRAMAAGGAAGILAGAFLGGLAALALAQLEHDRHSAWESLPLLEGEVLLVNVDREEAVDMIEVAHRHNGQPLAEPTELEAQRARARAGRAAS